MIYSTCENTSSLLTLEAYTNVTDDMWNKGKKLLNF